MTSEERDIRLTAYALNDPSLSPAARESIEALLASDASARQAVEETRQLAGLLTEGLAAEQAEMPMAKAVTIPATKATTKTSPSWTLLLAAAAMLMFAVAGVTSLIWSKWHAEHEAKAVAEAKEQEKKRFYTEREEKAREIVNRIANGTATAEDREALAGLAKEPSFSVLPDGTSNAVGASTKTPVQVDFDARGGINGGFGGGGFAGGFGGGTPIAGSGGSALFKDSGGGFRPGMPKPPVSLGFPGGPGLPTFPSEKPKPSSGLIGPGVNVESPPSDPAPGLSPAPLPANPGEPTGNDRHPQLVENAFIKVEGQSALSTFGVDVDTASYSIVRKYLTSGQFPPADAVRLEEMVNYFPYADKAPEGADPFAVTVEMADCPWEPAHRLVRLGLKAKPIASDKRPPSNLVFLIDVSGSMDAPNRLPLVKQSLKLLVNQLGENDRVAMVVYAGTTGLVLESTSAMHKARIIDALDRLEAGGSTNGAGGIQQAYEVAKASFIKNGTNRVILCTDGDWNVGTTSTEDLVKLIEEKRKTGVYLGVFGFGMGNLRDEMLVKLAGKGNGNYGYIDTEKEAHKLFVEQLSGTLVTVAKDVKIQIEFNPAAVKSYRLLGYEKRILAAKDFHDDTKDAGEMGAGHVVTALYELVPAGAADPEAGKVDGLRYQTETRPAVKKDEAFVVKMRHKKPDSDTSTLRELVVKNETKAYEKASEDFQFSAAVASFAMTLKDSQYKGSSNFSLVLELVESAKKREPGAFGEYRAEFVELVKKAKSLAGK